MHYLIDLIDLISFPLTICFGVLTILQIFKLFHCPRKEHQIFHNNPKNLNQLMTDNEVFFDDLFKD